MLLSKLRLILYSFVFLEDKSFLFGTLCHHEKCRGFGLFVGPCSLWELLISFVDIWFSFLKWDKSLSVCVYLFFMLIGFALFTCWTLESIFVLIWFFDVIWTIHWRHTFCVRPWLSWCFVQIVSPFGSWKFCMHIYYMYSLHA